ncbi:hypothetical protein AB0899_22035 [Streptomyces sp. NPDC007002]|uniref:hypothetical protein n=1 Tax=Streptomyces sp. NPDC007002 TaxID=3156910 RepID=UPI0034529E39
MSRTHWWSLTALLAVVLGLLCGPGASAAGPGTSAPVTQVTQVARGPAQAQDAGARGRAATGAEAPGRAEAEGEAPDRTRHRAHLRTVTGAVPEAAVPEAVNGSAVAEAAGERAPVPGCGKLRDHDGEPAVPSRARSSHDHVPGLASWGLPAATGAPSAEPTPGIRARAPVPYTPTPVELSVLRV